MSQPADPTAQDGLPPWAVVTSKRADHVCRVVALLEEWARVGGVRKLVRDRWVRAGWLHDALRDADEATLRELLPGVDDAMPFLHGQAAAVMARREGENDESVLDAVRWHTMGCADWDDTGRALYAADFLEPGRKFLVEERAALASRWPEDPVGTLREIVRLREQHQADKGRISHPISVTFRLAVLG